MTESDLINACREGDRNAFGTLYREHVGRIYTFLLWNGADIRDAEELTQDVFTTAWRKIGGFRGECRFVTWLTRIALNSCRSRARRLKRRSDRETYGIDPDTLGGKAVRYSREEVYDLEKAVKGLPRRARTVLILTELLNLPQAEAASMMKTSIGTVKAQLSRAKKLLRKELDR